MESEVQHLAAALRQVRGGQLLVVTGAGISLASGIPTFRGTDPGAIWKNDVLELGTFQYFQRDPVGFWQWILKLADPVAQARPNPAHYALAALEGWHTAGSGSYLLVTQNIDTLHESAGSQELVKVHGSADRVRCSRRGCKNGAPRGSLPAADFDMTPFQQAPHLDALPRCPECNSLLRTHALLFDEYYTEHVDYQFERVEQAAVAMDLALFVGTSFSVGITDLVLRHALSRRTPVISIDPGVRQTAPLAGIEVVTEKAEEVLPAVCGELGVDVGPGEAG